MITKKNKRPGETLRSKAEKILFKQSKLGAKEPEGDIQKLVHELQVHQIELEMQNDELRSKQLEISEARDRYLDLYDFAPVSYFTFDKTGRILEVNLTGAHVLGLPRPRLIGMPFTLFVDETYVNTFFTHLKKVLSSEVAQTSELRIKHQGKEYSMYVSLRSVAIRDNEGTKCRSTAMDITDRRLAEEELLQAREELVRTNDRLRRLSDDLLKLQEEERKQIALEVHDSFASSLSAIRHKLQDLPLKLKDEYNLEEITKHLETAIGEAQRIQTSLRPSVLDDLGIGPALNWFLREFQKIYPLIEVEKMFQFMEKDIPDAIKIAIFRITQEAMSNIGRHSRANCVGLFLSKNNHSIEFAIRDNGEGFDVENTLSIENPRRGLGLSSMKERAALSGGSFHIESVPGKGVSIQVFWDLTKLLSLSSSQ